nr:DNA translocase FtsK [Methylobacterium thuringiense]
MALRSNVARRLYGPPQRSAQPVARPAPEAPPSWLTAPGAMLAQPEPARPSVAWSHHAFEDGIVPQDAYDLDPSYESRIDAGASGAGVLVRTPRRPDSIVPAAMPAQAYDPSVRFTRTPDPVLQERRQRAIEAEREAQRQVQALHEAQAAAFAAAEAAREAAAAEALRAQELAIELAAQKAEDAARAAAEAMPAWRRPFVPPPGVRFFRTPDRPRPPAPKPVAVSEEPVPDAEWSDVPDWSDLQGWFGAAESSSTELWFADAPSPDVTIPQAVTQTPEMYVSVPLDVSLLRALPTAPVYALDHLVRFEGMPMPLPANAPVVLEQDDMRPAAAKPALSLVPGGLSERAAPAPRPAHSAMAARAAIRPAVTPQPVVPTPVATFPSPPPFVQEEIAAAPRPVPIPSRPVLLRTPKSALSEIDEPEIALVEPEPEPAPEPVAALPAPVSTSRAIMPERRTLVPANQHVPMSFVGNENYELPALELLAEPMLSDTEEVDADELEQNALNLQQTVQDFGVRGDILAVRPGPVVTLYELEPAPGTKSSRVIGLSDDIARSMSAVSARVAVVPGRNVIGIELPNAVRETVYLRELLASEDFVHTKHKLALCLGKNIGGEPIIADLARMPHLLVAGTTGSGKSVAINTMILSLLYRLKPEECRLIMVDPKMLELSVYDGIPHLLSPVVIDPKKAVIALKWAVREMEERYKKMSKVGVRNIDGYNGRMKEAREKGEVINRTIQTGFNRETGEAVFVEEAMDLSALPYIVIVVDEMADLMMVAGKDIEGAIQRLAQMARAAGIHLIMATQRPSVDVITGTIKANFPTRISFQVTSKIDSRTILGEMGAEQLLGQGDMLFMAGGGRTTRVHGPFCSDSEVETVVDHLKRQGRPSYLEAVTADDGTGEPEKATKGSRAKADKEEAEGEEADAPVFDVGAFVAASGGDAADLYDQAIAVVLRDKKASTSYIQRRLQIGYNRAASIMERMEIEGIVGPANHAGKREILVDGVPMPSSGYDDDE